MVYGKERRAPPRLTRAVRATLRRFSKGPGGQKETGAGATLLTRWEVAAAAEGKLLTEPRVRRWGWLGWQGALRCAALLRTAACALPRCRAERLQGTAAEGEEDEEEEKRRAPSRRTI